MPKGCSTLNGCCNDPAGAAAAAVLASPSPLAMAGRAAAAPAAADAVAKQCSAPAEPAATCDRSAAGCLWRGSSALVLVAFPLPPPAAAPSLQLELRACCASRPSLRVSEGAASALHPAAAELPADDSSLHPCCSEEGKAASWSRHCCAAGSSEEGAGTVLPGCVPCSVLLLVRR